ncbi:MAG: carboxypeptidase-like regulatory domain-containing protein, partial [Methanobacteriota archaeon]
TLGDAADTSGNFFISSIPPGDYVLIVSMIGYEIRKIPIRLLDSETKSLQIELSPKVLQGRQITVTARFPKEWAKNLKIFEKAFFGLTDFAKKCRLINPEVLDFRYDMSSGHFEATAEQPVRFANEALGYEVSFILERFTLDLASGNLYSVSQEENLVVLQEAGIQCKGILRFAPLQARNKKETQTWQKNRRRAYNGSFQHFLRSLWNDRVQEEGFEIFGTEFPHAKDEQKLKREDILHDVAKREEKLLSFPAYLKVVFKNESDPICQQVQLQLLERLNWTDEDQVDIALEQVYRKCGRQVSWLRIRNAGGILINKRGQVLSRNAEIEFAGYWKWNTLGESLPITYADSSIVN